MPTLSTPPANTSDVLAKELDPDLLRAQVVNALAATAKQLSEQKYPTGYHISYVRLRADGAVFLGTCQAHGTRLYDFQLLSNDGRYAKLFRLTSTGETLPFEECDSLLASVIGEFLGPTVHQLYLTMHPEDATPVHEAPGTLQ